MFPYLLDFGTADLPVLGPTRLALPTYGLLFASGVVVAWTWFHRRAVSRGVPPEPAFNVAFYALIAGMLGAKLGLVAVDWRAYAAHPAELLGTLRSAGVLMSGVAAGAIAFVAYARARRLPVFALGDAIAAPLSAAQAIGRLGCFSAGCCWGVRSTSSWLAVVFRNPDAHALTGVPLGVPLVPVQLVQFACDLALALVLTVLWRRRLPAGTVMGAYLVLYGAVRGTIEFWRGDDVRGLWLSGTVSTSQLLSVVAIVAGVTLLAIRSRARRSESTA